MKNKIALVAFVILSCLLINGMAMADSNSILIIYTEGGEKKCNAYSDRKGTSFNCGGGILVRNLGKDIKKMCMQGENILIFLSTEKVEKVSKSYGVSCSRQK